MAENESLNLRRSARWSRLYLAISNGKSADQVCDLARANLYRTLRGVKKLIPFKGLLSAACNDPDLLRDLIRQCGKGREFARIFERVAEREANCERVLQSYLREMCEIYFDQIATDWVPSESCPNLPDLRRCIDKVRINLNEDIEHIAHKMSEDPDWRPRMRPNRNGLRSKTSTQALLNESLLGVARQ